MSDRLEYSIGVMYFLSGQYRQKVFVINSSSIDEGLALSNLQNVRENRYLIAGRIAKSEIEFTIPAARNIEWTGSLLTVPVGITNPSKN
jgi:hypothetical protein